MTDDMMALKGLVEKSADGDFLREMIGFAAERLIAMEVGALTGAGYHEKTANGWFNVMATETVTGRPGPERSNFVFQSCAKAATSLVS